MTDGMAAFGTLIKIGDGEASETFTTIAEVTNIGGPGLKLDTEEVTHHGSTGGYKEHVATLLEAGEISLDLNFIPTNATQSQTSGLIADMVARTLRNFQLVFPDSGSTTWTFAAYVTSFQPAAPVGGKLAASVTLKPSGQPTLAG